MIYCCNCNLFLANGGMDNASSPRIGLDSFWAYQVVVLADQVSRYTLEIVRSEADLNQSQWRVLAAIADKPGRSAAEVTSVTPMDKTIVSRAVASLIQDGLIKRTPSRDDKRRAALEMTDIGAERYAQISKKLSDTLNAALIDGHPTQGFNAELKHFSAYMSALTASQNT
jgi:DNA-binding MarR family transcriptional regulator